MGLGFWRNPVDVKYDRPQARVYERYKADLEAGGKFKPEESKTQADINSRAVVPLARMAGVAPDKMDDFAAQIQWSDDRKTLSVPEYAMPITQGSEWHMGPVQIDPKKDLPVLQITNSPLDRKSAISRAVEVLRPGIKNEDSGFVLTMTRSDAKKAAGGYSSEKERVFRSVSGNIEKIVQDAIRVESHTDVKHRNKKVQGIHHFVTPVEFEGKLWRVQLLVKDIKEPGKNRTNIHTIDGIQIEEAGMPPVGLRQSEGGISYAKGVTAASTDESSLPVQLSQSRTVSLSHLLGGDKPYIRQDGKGFFDSVDDTSRAEGGVYYERRMNCHRFSTKSAITELRAFLMPLLWLTSEVAKALKLTDGDCTSL